MNVDTLETKISAAGPEDSAPWPIWPWLLLAMMVLIDLVWIIATPIEISSKSLITIALLMPIVIIVFFWMRWIRSNELFYVLSMGMAFMLAAWPALRIFNHISMTTALPFADAMLSDWDSTIGFDWFAYIHWLDGQDLLINIMNWTYSGLSQYSIIFFILLACFPKRMENCFEFLALFIVSSTLCMVVGMLFPAEAAMIFYAPDLTGFTYAHPGAGTYHIDALNNLREAHAPILDLSNLPGLVTFPSFHTAMGLVLIYVCRSSIILLVLSLCINLSMIAATPLYGSHYGIDLIGGFVAALITILIVHWLPKAQTIGGLSSTRLPQKEMR